MIINESKLNEVKSVQVGNGATAYQYGGKYYLKKDKDKKEITADQFNKLRSKGDTSNNKSSTEPGKSNPKESDINIMSNLKINDVKDPIELNYGTVSRKYGPGGGLLFTSNSGDEWILMDGESKWRDYSSGNYEDVDKIIKYAQMSQNYNGVRRSL